MLAVWLVVAFFAVLGLGLFFIAIRGGLGGARAALQGQSVFAQRTAAATFLVLYLGFGIALPAVFLNGNHTHASKQVGGIRLTGTEKTGRELFGERCAVCHTLSAANAIGKVGPNLDQIQPGESLVFHTITNGCLQNASPTLDPQAICLGYGTMPAAIYQGKQAQQVAAFVATVAGKE